MKDKFAVLFAVGGLAAFTTAPVHAITPTSAPVVSQDNRLPMGGQITSVDPKTNSIVVGGTTYTISDLTNVYGGGGRLRRDSLSVGATVRFNHTAPKDGGRHPVITDIEVLLAR